MSEWTADGAAEVAKKLGWKPPGDDGMWERNGVKVYDKQLALEIIRETSLATKFEKGESPIAKLQESAKQARNIAVLARKCMDEIAQTNSSSVNDLVKIIIEAANSIEDVAAEAVYQLNQRYTWFD